MTDLIDEAWAVADRLYDRLGTQSARGLDIDACVVISTMAEELERRAASSPNCDGDKQ